MVRDWGFKDKKALVTGNNEVAAAVRQALSSEGAQIAEAGDKKVHNSRFLSEYAPADDDERRNNTSIRIKNFEIGEFS